jgi:hypothetical protein
MFYIELCPVWMLHSARICLYVWPIACVPLEPCWYYRHGVFKVVPSHCLTAVLGALWNHADIIAMRCSRSLRPIPWRLCSENSGTLLILSPCGVQGCYFPFPDGSTRSTASLHSCVLNMHKVFLFHIWAARFTARAVRCTGGQNMAFSERDLQNRTLIEMK